MTASAALATARAVDVPSQNDGPRCAVPQCEMPGRLYAAGRRCDEHSPWNTAGHQRPGRTAYGAQFLADRQLTPAAPTVIDTRAVASGRRRSSPENHRAARDEVAQSRADGRLRGRG